MKNPEEEPKFGSTPNHNVAEKFLDHSDKNKNEAAPEPYRFWFSRRFLILILLFLGSFIAVLMRVYLNIAVIEMTTNKTILIGNQTIHRPAEFDWDTKTIGTVLAMQWYGFLFSAIGGHIATKFGGSVTYGITSAISAIFTFLNPLILGWNYYAFLSWRVLTGLIDGFAYASTAEVFSRWIPIKERSTLMSIIFCGIYVSIAVTYPVCGYVTYYWGWRTICYISGALSLTWAIVWLIIVKNEPSKDPRISRKELSYILRETDSISRKEITYPYKEIFTSLPVWAACIGKFAYGWGFGIIVISLPQYVKDITQKQVNEIGAISSLPNIVCIFMTPIAGVIMDYLQNNTNLKPTQIHKIMMSVGFIASSILFAGAAFSANFTVSMICFVLIKLFLSFNFLILQLICLFLAPRYSSIVLGITAFWYVLTYIIIPNVVGYLIVNHSMQEWNMCFLLSAAVLMAGAIVHLIYGSSDLQPWATPSSDNSKKTPIVNVPS